MGGWPLDLDITDHNDMKKYIKKKLEKTSENFDKFTPSVKKMVEKTNYVID